MKQPKSKLRKKPGPKPTGKGTQVQVRLQPAILAALDKFIKEEGGDMSRPEAIRLILTDSLVGLEFLPLDQLPPTKLDAN